MRHRVKGKILGREAAPRKALVRSLMTNLVIYEKILTTEAKAKMIRPIAEKIVTLGKKDNLHHRRLVAKKLYLVGAVKKVFEVLGPRYQKRNGGYIRVIKGHTRPGDGAKMAVLEFLKGETIVVTAPKETATKTVSGKKIKAEKKLSDDKRHAAKS